MIHSCMKRHVIAVSPETTAQQAARIVVANHVGTLPVVDEWCSSSTTVI